MWRESYSECCQTAKEEHFKNIVNSEKPLTSFAEPSILRVYQASEYASGIKLAESYHGKGKKNLHVLFNISEQILDIKPFRIHAAICFDAFHYPIGFATEKKMKKMGALVLKLANLVSLILNLIMLDFHVRWFE